MTEDKTFDNRRSLIEQGTVELRDFLPGDSFLITKVAGFKDDGKISSLSFYPILRRIAPDTRLSFNRRCRDVRNHNDLLTDWDNGLAVVFSNDTIHCTVWVFHRRGSSFILAKGEYT